MEALVDCDMVNINTFITCLLEHAIPKKNTYSTYLQAFWVTSLQGESANCAHFIHGARSGGGGGRGPY